MAQDIQRRGQYLPGARAQGQQQSAQQPNRDPQRAAGKGPSQTGQHRNGQFPADRSGHKALRHRQRRRE